MYKYKIIIASLIVFIALSCAKKEDEEEEVVTPQKEEEEKELPVEGIRVKTFAGRVDKTISGADIGVEGNDVSNDLRLSTFKKPHGIVTFSAGVFLTTDAGNKTLKKISIAADATGVEAFSGLNIEGIFGVAKDGDGNIYLSGSTDHKIYKISAGSTTAVVIAGSSMGHADNATGTNARFNHPNGIVWDSNNSCLYVADFGNKRIRKISLTAPYEVTTIAGNVSTASEKIVDNDSTMTSRDEPLEARFLGPSGLLLMGNGDLLVSDQPAQLIRKIIINADGSIGEVSTVAGSKTSVTNDAVTDNKGYFDSTTPTDASFDSPSGMVLSPGGNVYIADTGNDVIRKIVVSNNVFGEVSTIAGNTNPGFKDTTADDAENAEFDSPQSLAFDGNMIYVTDSNNHVIRSIEFEAGVTP